MTTPYHSKYYAHELTRKYSAHQLEKLSQSILSASVDLNPHQIDAALFAFRSPLSRGAILADEVGLGKTIEAALIISQLWAENKRHILCIVPAALRKQWEQELLEKFFINSQILDSPSYKELEKSGVTNPFDQNNKIVICSYQFARAKMREVGIIHWDLVVVDEAHRLRNVYKKDNKIAKAIKDAIGPSPKILLTATPLQNSIMELYGLISFIDPHIFGDEASFREQFAKKPVEFSETDFTLVKSRISPVCKRTLRRQVLEYISYTNRISMTQDFTPTDAEIELYTKVSAYLQRPSYALPSGQRALLTLVIRKILASSSFAISDTIGIMIDRLKNKLKALESGGASITLDLSADFESANEIEDEFEEENGESVAENSGITDPQKDSLARDITSEIDELKDFKSLAEAITVNAKGNALLVALKAGLAKAVELGAPPKALIFTESRRTQKYLKELLENNGYAGRTITLNGTNTEPGARVIHKEWLKRHENEDCAAGSYSVDIRAAIVEEFKERTQIMIATESGAEGLNLQFCNLVINYDLPWNPQRIEQRIGRCHRYGQKHDVVVINFINRKNEADQRVFEILSEKLKLFSGIFGASDEILGALGSGIDFEKRILEIYQSCRTSTEIRQAFDLLEAELRDKIDSHMADARAKLLENFDEDVHASLKLSQEQTQAQLDRFTGWLWQLTRHELSGHAEFSDSDWSFDVKTLPSGIAAPSGRYQLITQKAGLPCHHYRIGHPLADSIIQTAKERPLTGQEIVFDYSGYDKKITPVAELSGQKGWLRLCLITVKSIETEERLIFAGFSDSGVELPHETCEKFFNLSAQTKSDAKPEAETEKKMAASFERHRTKTIEEISKRNQDYFEAELEKLEAWSEDLKNSLERELKDLDREIKTVKREARQTEDLDAKISLHKKANDMERKRNQKRQTLFAEQDGVDDKKDTIIGALEAQLKQQTDLKEILTLRWQIV
ncbi:MAG: DEAD/DEAH box helicase family protein [Elusimicrobia bacterium]|nr:DEAD/DEAH box helicase family protein [Elusimicrobiota bacterium]